MRCFCTSTYQSIFVHLSIFIVNKNLFNSTWAETTLSLAQNLWHVGFTNLEGQLLVDMGLRVSSESQQKHQQWHCSLLVSPTLLSKISQRLSSSCSLASCTLVANVDGTQTLACAREVARMKARQRLHSFGCIFRTSKSENFESRI